MILVRKIYLLIVCGALSLLGTITPMSLDELYKGLLDDIEKNQPTQESLEMLKKHKNGLTHQYQGLQWIVFLAKEITECAKQYRDLEQQNSQDIQDIERLIKLGGKVEALREIFSTFIELGKGDQGFEKELPKIMVELEKDKKLYGAAIGEIKYAFPHLYPELDEPDEELVDDEPIQDSFVYAAPPTDLALAASRFCAKWKELKGNPDRGYSYHAYNSLVPLIESDQLQTDLAGQTLLARTAHWWHDCDDPNHRSWQKNNRRGLFRDMLDQGRQVAGFVDQLSVVMDIFLRDEVGYAPLLIDLELRYPGHFEAHKVLRTHTPAVKEQPSPEKLCAFHVAELLMNFYQGDDQLSNFLSLIKERPGLVHACEPGGLSLLHLIVRAYERANEKRKTMLLRLFDMFLLMGADATKKCRISKRAYEYQNSSDGYVMGDAPSVEEILNDYRKDAEAAAYLPHHPHGNRNSYSLAIGQSTAMTFKARLDAWKAGTTARLEGNTGEWLKEHMPSKPVVLTKEEKAERRKEQKEFEKEQRKLIEQQLQQKPSQVRVFFDRWKGTVGYFLVGAAVTGLSYWLWKKYGSNQSLEDIRQERQRARALMRAS
jgi:hypothetical protein